MVGMVKKNNEVVLVEFRSKVFKELYVVYDTRFEIVWWDGKVTFGCLFFHATTNLNSTVRLPFLPGS
jgi:hypothetical protein